MLEVHGIHKTFHEGTHVLHVLRGVELTVAPGDTIALVGPSGAGKSTLLHIMGGLDAPTKGRVLLDGRSLYEINDTERAKARNTRIGFVFRFYHLLPELTALENVMLPALIQNHRGRREVAQRATECLVRVGLGKRLTHRPSQLSGGELQRAAIARALMNEPHVLLCDEPTGNLDSATGAAIADLLLGLRAHEQRAVVLVTHDESLARRADRVLHMRDGQLVREGR